MTTASEGVELSGALSPNPVIARGDGSPVVFLHGPFGQEWPGFLDDLAGAHRVYAPANPGAEEPADLELLDDMHDLVVYYDELFENLGVGEPFDLVGHSFGGMVAAEYAAAYPGKVRRLVLIDSMGLWTDEVPVEDFITVAPETLVRRLWSDLAKPEVVERITPPDDVAEAQAAVISQFVTLASVAHFTAPIPERGLWKRLRRVRAQTLLVWGAQDGLVPARYAEEFRRHLPAAQVEIVEGAGHYPYVEQRESVSRRVLDFLA
ncbi:MAG TPA: alpha/beta hydrolase [Pseudonocardia sp.]|jgi:pimeloyl-ACP methyl ester carboxylesterase|nr:alpha/beta hydrolase [Pseudonocardia sp.]